MADTERFRLRRIVERLVRGEFADTASANKALEPIKAPVRAMDKSLAELVRTGLVAPDEAARKKILVDNPARLYGFA